MTYAFSRPGAIDGAVSTRAAELALFLVEYGGLVLNLFQDKTLMRPLHTVVPITGAKSFDFPIHGQTTGGYHAVGAELVGLEIKHGKRNIALDPLLTTDVLIDNLEEVMNYWPVRQAYANEMAFFLAKTFDGHCFREIIKGATTAAGAVNAGDSAFTGMLAGYVYNNTDLYPDGDGVTNAKILAALTKGLAAVAKNFDSKNVPREGRYCILPPDIFWAAMDAATTIANSGIINKDVNGAGGVSSGSFGPVYGFEIMTSNLLPYINESAVESGINLYHKVNSLGTKGLCFQSSAIGSVVGIDVNVDVFERKELRAWHMIAEYAMGHGVLRPECCAQLSSVAAG